MKRPDLTIVIPTYNNAEYLARVLGSAYALEGVSLEVILVDDGSTDHTPQLLPALSQSYPDLVCIRTRNGGLSAARNTGIERATGRYVMLLDADDEAITNDLASALASDADLIRIGTEEIGIDGSVLRHEPPAISPCSGPAYLRQCFLAESFYTPAWAYLYRLDWLRARGLVFQKGLIHEDMLFSVQALLAAESVTCFNPPVYRYFKRPGSITTSTQEHHYLQRIRSLEKIVRELIQMGNAYTDVDLSHWIVTTNDHALQIARKSRTRKAKAIALRSLLWMLVSYRGPSAHKVRQQERWRLREIWRDFLFNPLH